MIISSHSKIQDVKIFNHDKYADGRGAVVKVFDKQEFADLVPNFGEFNYIYESFGKKDVLRGFHYQVEKPQPRLVRVSCGAVYNVILDLRKSSSTFGKWQTEILTSDNPTSIWLPVGLAHAYLVLSDFAIVDTRTNIEYIPDFQRVIKWNDPYLAIEWPLYAHYPIIVPPIISDRDQLGVNFSQADFFE